jgi:hypothetical protein
MSLETIVQSRIGALNSGRVFAVQAPEGTVWPVIVWQRISSASVTTHDGATDFYQVRVQATCYASTATAARALREQVVAAMETSDTTVADKGEGYEEAAEVYRADADFMVWANN